MISLSLFPFQTEATKEEISSGKPILPSEQSASKIWRYSCNNCCTITAHYSFCHGTNPDFFGVLSLSAEHSSVRFNNEAEPPEDDSGSVCVSCKVSGALLH